MHQIVSDGGQSARPLEGCCDCQAFLAGGDSRPPTPLVLFGSRSALLIHSNARYIYASESTHVDATPLLDPYPTTMDVRVGTHVSSHSSQVVCMCAPSPERSTPHYDNDERPFQLAPNAAPHAVQGGHGDADDTAGTRATQAWVIVGAQNLMTDACIPVPCFLRHTVVHQVFWVCPKVMNSSHVHLHCTYTSAPH